MDSSSEAAAESVSAEQDGRSMLTESEGVPSGTAEAKERDVELLGGAAATDIGQSSEEQGPYSPLAHVKKLTAVAEKKRPSKPKSTFDCNVCLDVASEPVITLCGHLFCWPCLYPWLNQSESCPVCKAVVKADTVIPVYTSTSQEENDDADSGEGSSSLPSTAMSSEGGVRRRRKGSGEEDDGKSSDGDGKDSAAPGIVDESTGESLPPRPGPPPRTEAPPLHPNHYLPFGGQGFSRNLFNNYNGSAVSFGVHFGGNPLTGFTWNAGRGVHGEAMQPAGPADRISQLFFFVGVIILYFLIFP